VMNCARALSIGVDEFIVIRPYNGTHREIILLHVHEPIKFHDPSVATLALARDQGKGVARLRAYK
jgi:hypothetical protein